VIVNQFGTERSVRCRLDGAVCQAARQLEPQRQFDRRFDDHHHTTTPITPSSLVDCTDLLQEMNGQNIAASPRSLMALVDVRMGCACVCAHVRVCLFVCVYSCAVHFWCGAVWCGFVDGMAGTAGSCRNEGCFSPDKRLCVCHTRKFLTHLFRRRFAYFLH
jgi:hypothetical protein